MYDKNLSHTYKNCISCQSKDVSTGSKMIIVNNELIFKK